jgi:hypothetical protein
MNGLYFLPLPNNVSCFTSNVKLHRKSHWSTTSTLSVGFLVNMWMLGEGRDNRNGPAWSAPYSDVTKFEMPSNWFAKEQGLCGRIIFDEVLGNVCVCLFK